MRILLLDIETAPNQVFVWGLFNQFVSIDQIIKPGYTMCYSAKWYGKPEIYFDSINRSSPMEMTASIHRLLSQADVVVHWNGKKFDIPTLNKEFIKYRFVPPAPFKQLDLIETSKRRFRFTSNKLDFVAQELGLGKKLDTDFQLWVDCMEFDPLAWEQMEEYNKNDVVLLEKIYDRFMPWIPDHPNHGLYKENPKVCPNCGGVHYSKRGFSFTLAGKYQRYQCRDCGNWFKDAAVMPNNHAPKAKDRFTNA